MIYPDRLLLCRIYDYIQIYIVTLQDFSPPMATHPLPCEWWTWPPQAAMSTTHTNSCELRSSEESKRENLSSQST